MTDGTTTSEPISLPDPPSDGISRLSYLHPSSSHDSLLVSTSWDGNIRIHDTSQKKLLSNFSMESGPLLDLDIGFDSHDSERIFTAGVDGSVRQFNIPTSTITLIGYHSESMIPTNGESNVACSCVSSLSNDLLASAGWDGQFYLWDVRNRNNTNNVMNNSSKPLSNISLPGKAFSMDSDPLNGNRVVISTAGRKTCVIDIRMMGTGNSNNDDTHNTENHNASSSTNTKAYAKLVLERESSLKYQTRTVKFLPDATGFAVGSIEGRVALEFLEDLKVPSNGRKKYAFKCHRIGDTVYPVNAITFHPKYHTFATGGCDGTISTWDGLHKKKLATLPKFSTSIAALAFNHNGSELAIASSYTFEEGDRDHPRDEIFVRSMLDVECRPKLGS